VGHMKDTAASAAARQKRGGPARPARTVSATVDIDAPPMAVWAVLTDLSGYPEWNPHFREGAGEVAAGNRLTLKVFDPNRVPVTIHPLVLAAEPGVEWRSLGGIPGRLGRLIFSGEHRFALTRVVIPATARGWCRARPFAVSSCPSLARPSPQPRRVSGSRTRRSRSTWRPGTLTGSAVPPAFLSPGPGRVRRRRDRLPAGTVQARPYASIAPAPAGELGAPGARACAETGGNRLADPRQFGGRSAKNAPTAARAPASRTPQLMRSSMSSAGDLS